MELDNTYKSWFATLKFKIKNAQIKAAVSVNTQLIELYWELGQEIIVKQESSDWGSSFIEQLSVDLKQSFPNIKGFSRRNLSPKLSTFI